MSKDEESDIGTRSVFGGLVAAKNEAKREHAHEERKEVLDKIKAATAKLKRVHVAV